MNADEFGILLTDLDDTEPVTWIVKRIFDKLSEKIHIDGHDIFVTCSAGVSLYPHDGDDADRLIENAGTARHDAKHRFGRNNLRFFSSKINKAAYRQLWLESQLHTALEGGELMLHYQPQLDLGTMRIRGMEALLRWRHPKLGLIPPTEFVPIAERTGLIHEIGDWVLRSACEQARIWLDQGYPDLVVTVNVSGVQLRNNDLQQSFMNILRETNLPQHCLELEVTESTLMDHGSESLDTMIKLHEAGIRFAIDDFGTGYSSLSSLRNLPVHSLKIDRSFLSDSFPDSNDQSIISAIISMSHSLGLRVVAEGVETDEQLKFLRTHRCDDIQGFLFSRPLTAERATQLLRRNTAAAVTAA